LKVNVFFILVLGLFISSCSTTKKIESNFSSESQSNNYFRGLVVYNPQTNKVLINDNGHKYFTPASNTKLFTFYTAYRTFKDSVTGLKYIETKDSLIIKGTADPSFIYGFDESKTLDFLKSKNQDVYLIDNNIGESLYGSGWSWDDYTYYYMPEKSIFPMYGNVVDVSKKGNDISVIPAFFNKNFKIEDQVKFRRDPDENNFYVQTKADIHDNKIPFKTSNQLVADLLSKEIGKKVVLIPNKSFYKFLDFKSIKYDSLYKKMLVISDNFIAEQIMLQVGNQVDSVYSVAKAIDYSLNNYLQDIPQKPRWVDGSGLSRYNLFTPESLVYLLSKMYREIPTEKLLSYFPIGGDSGTLKNYYNNEKPYIFAKSGSLSNNYNLSGYLITKKGTLLIFSYMNNHYQGSSSERKKEMEAFFKKLYFEY